jgi:capsid portal protein
MENLSFVPRATRPLYPQSWSEGLLANLAKSDFPEAWSNQKEPAGIIPHPFNFLALCELRKANEHHSACINAKSRALVGLGHPDADEDTGTHKVDAVLNPLCDSTWQETITDIAEDFEEAGNGYLEVVRRGSDIVGLYHTPAHRVYPVFEGGRDRHFVVESDRMNGSSFATRFAAFGDKDDFIRRMRNGRVNNANNTTGFVNGTGIFAQVNLDEPDEISEIIHIRRPSSLSKWYGYPNWLGAVAAIELNQMLMQYNFDFFLNRGVPEMMLFLLGSGMDKSDFDEISKALKANIGTGNSHKSCVVNLKVDPASFEVQLEKLMGDNGLNDDAFNSMRENIAMGIVSAHGVPPLLAGIQIPGKLGATNELPNALLAFQTLLIGPDQRLLSQKLSATLGNPEFSNLGLTAQDFRFKKITDEFNLDAMDTMGRMRQTAPEASAEGRDLTEGVRD